MIDYLQMCLRKFQSLMSIKVIINNVKSDVFIILLKRICRRPNLFGSAFEIKINLEQNQGRRAGRSKVRLLVPDMVLVLPASQGQEIHPLHSFISGT